MLLLSEQLGADNDILHVLHTKTIPEKDKRDLIGEIHQQFRITLRNMNRSPLDPRLRHLTVILLLRYWLGLLTSKVNCWVTYWLNLHSLQLSNTPL